MLIYLVSIKIYTWISITFVYSFLYFIMIILSSNSEWILVKYLIIRILIYCKYAFDEITNEFTPIGEPVTMYTNNADLSDNTRVVDSVSKAGTLKFTNDFN